ncbi:hypothetical protein [Ornithobacterium rhinotracheale]|uniref:hypothetical protein n=1 Tax=Ornithobacterium rhinotracheale TaxID=28251 RepID=UPI001FF4EDAA|nr:hypothetical protein [Ornithobacterium rhinotracheale]MCK0206366.1 hypothetical protein [Ornithobacterium rhinotracheale]
MKFSGSGTFENERANTVTLNYIGFALNEIKGDIKEMRESNNPLQILLGDIQVLISLIEICPYNISGRLKSSEVDEWQNCFNEWFERVKNKIPKEYRSDIKQDSVRLFDELRKYAHDIDWL